MFDFEITFSDGSNVVRTSVPPQVVIAALQLLVEGDEITIKAKAFKAESPSV